MNKNTENNTCNSNAGSNITALAITKDLIGQILVPADFSALDGLVQKLGARSASLTDGEKASAMEVVSEWDKTVVARIDANADMAKGILSFLSGNNTPGSIMDRYIQMFHDTLGDTKGYVEYQAALDEYYAVMADAPIDQPADPGMTVEEADKLSLANHAATIAHNRRRDAASFAVMKAAKTYVTALRAMPEVKEAMEKLRAYSRKASHMAAECRDKASRIKINIAISDTETRDLLLDLLDFSKGL